jgi:hypothetical protein
MVPRHTNAGRSVAVDEAAAGRTSVPSKATCVAIARPLRSIHGCSDRPVAAELTITASAQATTVSMRRRCSAAPDGRAYSGNSIGIRSCTMHRNRARSRRRMRRTSAWRVR